MQLIQISEPNDLQTNPEQANQEVIVGIDFGTTNSLIAIANGHASIIPMPDDREIVPSLIEIQEDKIILASSLDSNKNIIHSIKRILNKSTQEIKTNPDLVNITTMFDLSGINPRLKLQDQYLSMPTVASTIFKYLKDGAQETLQTTISKAVLTVPAHFDDYARGQVIIAAQLAGLEVIRLISEPTAAAYAYGLHQNRQGTYLVYDLGGGTFDVSILHMRSGILQVVATGGDNMLGGNDIDLLIAYHIAQKINTQVDNTIMAISTSAKHALSTQENTVITYKDSTLSISRSELEQIVLPIIIKTINIAHATLHEAHDVALDGIILVGGATRMPLITKQLRKHFTATIYSDLDPDKVVALGAAMQGMNLVRKSGNLLIDVLPLSLGLELYGGIVEKIILRNTPIPFIAKKEFTTHADYQTGMQFHIVQGEREMSKDCRSLAYFEIKDIPPAKAGRTKIEVTFAIDANGILSVSALNIAHGIISSIEIKPNHNLTEQEVMTNLISAYENAQVDHQAKKVTQIKQKAENLIQSITQAMQETPALLASDEKIHITNAITSLQMVMNQDNQESITNGIAALDRVSANFVQKHLNQGLETHIKGMHINDIK